MYDQTGHTGEGSAADYNNYHQGGGQGFNPEDIFGQFRGFNQRGSQNMGNANFEDILNDLFGGGGFQQGRTRGQQSGFDNSPVSMNLTLTFDESVKGVTKVSLIRSRLLTSNERVCARLVMAVELSQDLSPRNAKHAMGLELKVSGRECSS